jgi:hypothetical protein
MRRQKNQALFHMNNFVCNDFAIANELREIDSRRARLAESIFREMNPRKMQNTAIFAMSHGTQSAAKILFAVGEKDERAKSGTSEFIPHKMNSFAMAKSSNEFIRANLPLRTAFFCAIIVTAFISVMFMSLAAPATQNGGEKARKVMLCLIFPASPALTRSANRRSIAVN